MKSKSNHLILSIVAVLAIVASGAFVYFEFTQDNATAGSRTVNRCTTTGQRLSVTIQNNQMQPQNIRGKLCDKLTVTNKDGVTREIGFGEHDHHTAYDGVSEKLLTSGQSLTVTLNKTGTYLYHDHFHDEVAGTFIVTN